MSKDQGTTKTARNSDDDRILAELREKNPTIAETLERWQQHVTAAAQNEPQPNAPAKIIQLPFWADPVRGVPNALLRSAFFAAIHSKKRRQLGIQKRPEKPPEGIIIAAQKGDVIKFAGTQLNQYDADVFLKHYTEHVSIRLELSASFAVTTSSKTYDANTATVSTRI